MVDSDSLTVAGLLVVCLTPVELTASAIALLNWRNGGEGLNHKFQM